MTVISEIFGIYLRNVSKAYGIYSFHQPLKKYLTFLSFLRSSGKSPKTWFISWVPYIECLEKFHSFLYALLSKFWRWIGMKKVCGGWRVRRNTSHTLGDHVDTTWTWLYSHNLQLLFSFFKGKQIWQDCPKML